MTKSLFVALLLFMGLSLLLLTGLRLLRTNDTEVPFTPTVGPLYSDIQQEDGMDSRTWAPGRVAPKPPSDL